MGFLCTFAEYLFNNESDMNALDNASIKDDNSKGLTSFALPEAKSSKTGVSVRYVHENTSNSSKIT
jgi:hypothetical protein